MIGTLIQVFAWNITGFISSNKESQLREIERSRNVLLTQLNSLKININILNPNSKEEVLRYLKINFSKTISDIDINISLIYGDKVGQIFNFTNLSIGYLLAVPNGLDSTNEMHPNILMLKNELGNKANRKDL